MLIAALLLTPMVCGSLLGLLGHTRYAHKINIAASFTNLCLSIILLHQINQQGSMLFWNQWFYVDAFNIFIVFLTCLVGFTTAVFSHSYMRNEVKTDKLSPIRLKLYFSMYQIFIGTMLMSLLTNNIGILWVAMEAATLSTVLLVSLYRTQASIEAAWKYFILCSVGIAQALLGTILIYFAAEKVIGNGSDALLWTSLNAIKEQLDPNISTIAFIFILVGYGTKVGLVPLHNWLPDAHAEGPTPISAILSGLLLNVALYAIIRCKILIEPSMGTDFIQGSLMGFGIISIVVASFLLSRQTDIKRLFSYSSIEHMGLITFAFGMGTPLGNFAALMHMTMHSLTKSAIFMAVGHAVQKAGTQQMKNIQGLIEQSPWVGWSLILGALAILGMPPFGVFTSKFLILSTAINEQPWAAPFIFLALAVAFGAIFYRVQGMVFGTGSLKTLAFKPQIVPLLIHFVLVIWLGVYMPDFLKEWYHHAAVLI